MYGLVRDAVTFIFYGVVLISIFYQVKGDKISLERKWLVSALFTIFGVVFLILTVFLMQPMKHGATGVINRWVLMILFSVSLLITGIYLLIYCSKIKKK